MPNIINIVKIQFLTINYWTYTKQTTFLRRQICKRCPMKKTNRNKYSITPSLNTRSPSSEVQVSRMPKLHSVKTD